MTNKYGKTYINLMRILKLCNIYGKYMCNKLDYDYYDYKHKNDIVFNGKNYHEILSSSVPWTSTNEGFDYWCGIYNKLENYSECSINTITSVIKRYLMLRKRMN